MGSNEIVRDIILFFSLTGQSKFIITEWTILPSVS